MVVQERFDSRVTVGHSRSSPTVPLYACGWLRMAPYKTVRSCLLGVPRPGVIFGLPLANNGLFQLLTVCDALVMDHPIHVTACTETSLDKRGLLVRY